MVVAGGMGTVAQALGRAAREAGAKIETGRWAASRTRVCHVTRIAIALHAV